MQWVLVINGVCGLGKSFQSGPQSLGYQWRQHIQPTWVMQHQGKLSKLSYLFDAMHFIEQSLQILLEMTAGSCCAKTALQWPVLTHSPPCSRLWKCANVPSSADYPD
jgi:hypothetical protein